MSRSVQLGITVGCLSLVALGLGALQWTEQSRHEGREVEVAARYHLRSRTPDFYARAKAGASPNTRAKR